MWTWVIVLILILLFFGGLPISPVSYSRYTNDSYAVPGLFGIIALAVILWLVLGGR